MNRLPFKYILLVAFQLYFLCSLNASDYPITAYLSIDHGLSNNSVRCIYQDSKGFMWFGTYDGLNRYDGYRFKVFRNNYRDSNSLINNWINSIQEDSHGRIWIGTRQGVCVYNDLYNRFSFVYYHDDAKKLVKVTSIVRSIDSDEQGNIFIGTSDGLFFCSSGDTLASRVILEKPNDPQKFEVTAITIGKDKTAWIFVRGKGLYSYDYQHNQIRLVNSAVTTANCLEIINNQIWIGASHGIYRYNTVSKTFDGIHNETTSQLNYKDVVDLTYDKAGKLWIATNGGGIDILDIASNKMEYLVAGTTHYSLNSNSVSAIWQDRDSRIWIGVLRGGINIIDPNKEGFRNIISESSISNTLVSDFIFCFYEEPDGNLWVGSDGAGISVWDRNLNRFTNYRHDPNKKGSLSDNFITGIKQDNQNNIWIATYRGGVNLFNKTNGSFEQYRFENSSQREMTDPLTFAILNDRQNNLWVSALQYGLFKFNRESKTFRLVDNTLRDLFVLYQDRNDVLWGGNLSQLIRIDSNNKSNDFFQIGKPIRSIHEDRKGNFWIGTEGAGLVLFDRKKNKIIQQYTTDEGLCSNSILNILEDESGNLWVSTFNGISMLDGKTMRFKNYYQSDGLQSNQFSYNAGLKLSSGELVFGGIKGFTLFRPQNIRTTDKQPRILFTALTINNRSIDQETAMIDKISDHIERIKVPFNKAVLSFEFSALEYSAPDKIQYAYYLEGWDRGWNYIGNKRNATYTHLSEGTYTLKIKCTNAAGVWSDQELRLKIIILPPWYRTWWAYLFYIITVVAAVYLYLQYRAKQTRLQYEVKIANLNFEKERGEKQRSIGELQREKMEREKKEAELLLEKANVEKEKAEKEREHAEREKERILNEKEREINEKRISFVTNISHEFRSPLSLIINPIKDLLKRNGEQAGSNNELHVIYRNARRMLSLVDQLLLFRKSESGLDTVQPSKLNFYSLAWEVYLCFVQQAKSKNISYSFECEDRDLEIYADREKLEIILFNLLSNAIKYTSEKGTVKLLIRSLQDTVEVVISDTGAGIPGNVGDRIFEKFYKPNRTLTGGEAGFGIGLYLVKHFTEQHNGFVSYESEEGKGSVFKLRLLKGNAHFGKIEEIKAPSRPVFIEELSEELLDDNNRTVSKEVQEVVSEKQTILIIDDDEQIRHYLNDLFKDQYLTKEAENGEKGLKQAQKNLPDLIISDVHMPGLDGIDLCKAIKENELLSHIPVILLTASASEIMKLRGVEGGADDYIVKPFDNTLLKARVANLLKRKNALQKYFYNEITLNKTEVKISGEYKEFIEKCIQIVENHLEDESFGVKTLLSEMGMSHSNLFRKVKSVSGQSVNVFIRYIRLRKAAEFFINTNYNVNETAFMVGINDLKYFREQFNKLFGMNPSDYIRKYRRLHGKQFTIDRESINPGDLSTDPDFNP